MATLESPALLEVCTLLNGYLMIMERKWGLLSPLHWIHPCKFVAIGKCRDRFMFFALATYLCRFLLKELHLSILKKREEAGDNVFQEGRVLRWRCHILKWKRTRPQNIPQSCLYKLPEQPKSENWLTDELHETWKIHHNPSVETKKMSTPHYILTIHQTHLKVLADLLHHLQLRFISWRLKDRVQSLINLGYDAVPLFRASLFAQHGLSDLISFTFSAQIFQKVH